MYTITPLIRNRAPLGPFSRNIHPSSGDVVKSDLKAVLGHYGGPELREGGLLFLASEVQGFLAHKEMPTPLEPP